MINKKVSIKLNVEEIKDTVKRLHRLKRRIQYLTDSYILECILRIRERAVQNLQSRVHFNNTTNINDSWSEPERIAKGWYRLRNTSDYSVVVEFGTGIVGGNRPHQSSGESGYEYGNHTWTFIRDLTNKEWKHEYYDMEDVKNNPDKYLVMIGYGGYEGKSYFYDAIFDFIESGEYIRIYEQKFKRLINDF